MAEKKWLPEKTMAKLITSLVVFILLIIFAIQNFQKQNSIKFLFWEIGKTPISIIIFVSILLGAIIAILALLPHILRLQGRVRRAEREAARRPSAPPAKDKKSAMPRIDAD